MHNNALYKPSDSTFRIIENTPTLKVVSNHNEKQNTGHDHTNFVRLYDTYAPKAFGFITNHTTTKEQAEEFLMAVFLKVWADIKTFGSDPEKKIQQIVLMICKPIYKKK